MTSHFFRFSAAALVVAAVLAPNLVSAQSVADLEARIAALLSQLSALQNQLAQAQGGGGATQWCHTFSADLRYGDGVGGSGARTPIDFYSSEVHALQTALQKDGFSIDQHEQKGGAVFQDSTAAAVVGFQEKYASEILTPVSLAHGTGYVGPSTRAKLNQLYGCGNVVPVSNKPIISGVSGPTQLVAGQQGIWTVNATDPSGGTLSYRAVWGDEVSYGILAPAASSIPFQQAATFTHTYAIGKDVALYTPTFTVTNQNGQSAETSISVRVTSASASTSTPAAITVTAPNGGETLTRGSSFNIQWLQPALYTGGEVPPAVLPVDISLVPYYSPCVSSGGPCPTYPFHDPYSIAKSVSRSGAYQSYQWVVGQVADPDGAPNGDYYVRICLSGTQSCGQSTSHFTIVSGAQSAAITVTAPNGGEAWSMGTTQVISWANTAGTAVDIFAVPYVPSCSGEICPAYVSHAPYAIAANVAQGLNTYSWRVGDVSGQGTIVQGPYVIRVCESGTTICDQSDGSFNIVAATPTVACDVTAPGTNQFTGCVWKWRDSNVMPTAADDGIPSGGAPPGPMLGSPVAGTATALNFNSPWPNMVSINQAAGPENYTVRWQGNFTFAPGTYQFTSDVDDGARIWVSGQKMIDDWRLGAVDEKTFTRSFPTQTTVPIQVDYMQQIWAGTMKFGWVGVSSSTPPQPATPSITVLSPAGGEQWQVGKTYRVSWRYASNFSRKGSINVELWNGAQFIGGLGVAADDISQVTYFDFQLPATGWLITAGSNYRIKVYETSNPSAGGSSGVFSIIVPSPTPQLGTLIPSDTFANFTVAQGASNPSPYNLHLTNGSSVPVNFTINVPNQPSWLNCGYTTQTLSLSSGGVMGVCVSVDASKVSAPGTYTANLTVSGNFTGSPLTIPITLTVTAPVQQPSITVTSPNGGEQLTMASGKDVDFNVTWTSANLSGTASVYLNFPNGGTCLLGSAPVSQGSFPVRLTINYQCPNIPNTVTPGQYRILLTTDTADPSGSLLGIHDSSDGQFSLSLPASLFQPSVVVLSPNGGEQWQMGSTQTIRWTSSNLGSILLSIAAVDAGGSNWTIASNIQNTGSYTWQIPTDFRPGPGNYRISVNTGDKNIAQDLSDAPFSVIGVAISTSTLSWDGAWVNANANTNSITHYAIRTSGSSLYVHPWAKCSPTDCDWGERMVASLSSGQTSVAFQWADNTSYTRTFTLTLLPDGRLHSVSNNTSPQYSYVTDEYFARQTASAPASSAYAASDSARLQQMADTLNLAEQWINQIRAMLGR